MMNPRIIELAELLQKEIYRRDDEIESLKKQLAALRSSKTCAIELVNAESDTWRTGCGYFVTNPRKHDLYCGCCGGRIADK